MAGSLLWALAGYPAWVESTVDVSTEQGPATVVLDKARKPTFLLVMTHGAGGGVDSADVLAARDAAAGLGASVARVLQPYRVRGARAPGNAGKQDAAWLEIIIALRKIHQDVPLVQGGRSNGARVACRTAGSAGAQGVIALAFPLHPPGRPESSRADELRHAGVPVLVVNGASDPFGIPAESDADRVVVLPGETHSLSRAPRAVRAAVTDWLSGLPWLAAG
jgi:predicted alpha/beta-hydrolase family hydrolase